jgi:hypothetical protein
MPPRFEHEHDLVVDLGVISVERYAAAWAWCEPFPPFVEHRSRERHPSGLFTRSSVNPLNC